MTESLPVDTALVEEAASLEPDAAEARHADLAEQVRRANRLYHEEDAPEISDAEYDQLFRRLVALEAAFPALVTPDSPTQKVGGTPAGGRFPEVRHRRPMLSLSNAFSHDELRAFDTRVRRGLGLAAAPEPADELTYVAELKIDGLAISLHYERGRFAARRHPRRRQHRRGRDAQPAHDPGDPGPPARARHARGAGRGVHAQGGVRADQRASARSWACPQYANPRNSGAGSLRQKDPAVTAGRQLSTWLYQLVEDAAAVDSQSGGARSPRPPSASRSTPIARPGLDIEGVIAFTETLARGAPPPAVRDRRRRGQGRPLRPAGAARDGQPRPALGHRVQVPARAGGDARSRTSSRTSAGPGR